MGKYPFCEYKIKRVKLIQKPVDSDYKNGWIYETVKFEDEDGNIIEYESISHTRSYSSYHPKRNKILYWASKAKIGKYAYVHIRYNKINERYDISLIREVKNNEFT